MAILWPAFALFALTMFAVCDSPACDSQRSPAGRVDPRFYKVFRGEGEPEEVAAISRNVDNLYEMPTLFYAGTAIAFAAGQAGTLLVALGWAYVALRVRAQRNPHDEQQGAVAFSCLRRSWLRPARLLDGAWLPRS